MPTHSVVLSSYNRPRMVREAISSILAQTVQDWQAIVADDGSTDETLAAIDGAVGDDPRFSVLRGRPATKDERRSLRARYAERINEALPLCTGGIVHYLADDDWFLPGRFAAFDRLFADPAVMVGYGRLQYRDGQGQATEPDRFPLEFAMPRWKLDHNQVAHRRECLANVPAWPSRGDCAAEGADGCFFNELWRHWRFSPMDEPVAVKRIHPLNMLSTGADTGPGARMTAEAPDLMPAHSVVLSSYNRPRMVREAISSILAQTVQDWQAIVADDGSTDETLAAIGAAVGDDPRFFVLRGKPVPEAERTVPGRYVDRINEALPLCTGGIVHYLADDDWFLPGRFAAFDRLFAAPAVMVGYGRLQYRDSDGVVGETDRFPAEVDWPKDVLDHNQVAHRLDCLKRVPAWPKECGYDKQGYGADGCFFNALREHWRFCGVDAPVAAKRVHPYCMQHTRERTGSVREAPG